MRFGEADTWVCTIRDFCAGGMLLKGDWRKLVEAYGGDDEGPPRGTRIEVHFSVRDEAGKQHSFHHPGQVARTVDDGLGLLFSEPLADAAQDALNAFAASNAESGAEAAESAALIDPELRKQVALTCARFTQRQLLTMVQGFSKSFRNELSNCYVRAGSDREQEQFLNASTELERHEKAFLKTFVKSVVDPILNLETVDVTLPNEEPDPSEAEPRASKSKSRLFSDSRLTLVGKDVFEHWLVLADMIASVEGDVGEETFVLQNWLGMIVPSWGLKGSNPCGPAAILRSFERSLALLSLEGQAARLAFEVFEKSCRGLLVQYFEDLVGVLSEVDVFPSIDQIVADQVKKQKPAPAPEQPREAASSGSDGQGVPGGQGSHGSQGSHGGH